MMKCASCGKEITPADVPGYTDFASLENEMRKRDNIHFLCKICREPIEGKDTPFDITMIKMNFQAEAGHLMFLKFTCHNCKARQTCDEPNMFFTRGCACEECNKISYPSKFGLMMMASLNGPGMRMS